MEESTPSTAPASSTRSPGTDPVVVEELALRNYAQRNAFEEVAVAGGTVRFRVKQDLFDADGNGRGVGRVAVVGQREFGGRVRFDPAEFLLEGTTNPEDANYLRTMAVQLVETLADLCRCGRLRPECDCCTACEGLGAVPSETGSKDCVGCSGAGFLAMPRPGP